ERELVPGSRVLHAPSSRGSHRMGDCRRRPSQVASANFEQLTSRRARRAIRLSESRAAVPRSAAYQRYPVALGPATSDRSFHRGRLVEDPYEIYDEAHPFRAVLRLVINRSAGSRPLCHSDLCCRCSFEVHSSMRRSTAVKSVCPPAGLCCQTRDTVLVGCKL